MSRRPVAAVLSLALLPSCFLLYRKAGPVPGMPSAAVIGAAQPQGLALSEASVARGRELFVAKCNHCHDYLDVRAVEQDELSDIMKKMGGKSHLGDADTQAVLSFVIAVRAAH